MFRNFVKLGILIFSLAFSRALSAQTVLKAELLLDTKSDLGEGAIWHPKEKKLYWVDINQGFLHLYDPASGKNETVELGQKVGTVVPSVSRGNAVVALHDGIYLYRFAGGGKLELLQPNPEKSTTNNRFNDGKCDPAGRFWFGTIGPNNSAALYRMDADRSIHVMKREVGTSNGIVWSGDKKIMYYIDTNTGKVVAYDYDNRTGDISSPRDAIVVPPGMGGPDGSTIDAEGMIWIAHWGGSCVARWNPKTGELLCKVEIPAKHVTSCAFGGKNLDTLYITTAREGLSEKDLQESPLSGGLFVVKPGVKGVKANLFVLDNMK
ncbi:MAG: SMP-30/gluconolactonase/LRE family protein [Prevotellaceae bacterium]|jgi:sugar lactone lactonase YvrE|nr:SMP-30/gluconolactonase/LRE family protein [Prevotellaceae bacterium]